MSDPGDVFFFLKYKCFTALKSRPRTAALFFDEGTWAEREALPLSFWELPESHMEEKVALEIAMAADLPKCDKYSVNVLSKQPCSSRTFVVYFGVYPGREGRHGLSFPAWYPLLFCDLWKSINLFAFVSLSAKQSDRAAECSAQRPLLWFLGPPWCWVSWCTTRMGTPSHLSAEALKSVSQRNLNW